jgi:undecaprenyl-diphosphatase
MENIGNIFYYNWELDLLNWFQGIRNEVLDVIVPKITFLGGAGWFWILVALVFMIIPFNRKIGFQSGLALIITALICNIILKPGIMRARPCWIFEEIELLVKIPTDFSFPSGHSNASFAVATCIFMRNKKLGIPFLVLAACIALSRLYVFVHWPTDVLAGIIIGVCGAIISYYIINFVYKKLDKN